MNVTFLFFFFKKILLQKKVAKLDKEIAQLLQSIPQAGVDAGILPPHIEEQLTSMLKERAFDLRKIFIRI